MKMKMKFFNKISYTREKEDKRLGNSDEVQDRQTVERTDESIEVSIQHTECAEDVPTQSRDFCSTKNVRSHADQLLMNCHESGRIKVKNIDHGYDLQCQTVIRLKLRRPAMGEDELKTDLRRLRHMFMCQSLAEINML